MTIFETFAGIGAQHKALNNLKNKNIIEDYKIIGISEWYISTIIAYTKIHYLEEYNKSLNELKLTKEQLLKELRDYTFSTNSKDPSKLKSLNLETLKKLYVSTKITNNLGSVVDLKSEDLPKVDVLTYSFPCQDLSNAGKKRGLEKGTRSGLLWEIGRILEGKELQDRPNILLMENVPTLFNKFKDGWDFWKEQLKEYGYISFDVILNSQDFNSPQIRKRAFSIAVKEDSLNIDKKYLDIIKQNGLLNEIETTKTYQDFQKTIKEKGYKKIKDILEKDVEEKYFINKKFNILNSTDGKTGAKFDLIDLSNYEIANRVYDINYCSPTLTTSGVIKIFPIEHNKKILRNIKEIEAFQLMGFEKKDFYNIEHDFTKGHLYRFAGNSIVVNVLEGLFEVINKLIKN